LDLLNDLNLRTLQKSCFQYFAITYDGSVVTAYKNADSSSLGSETLNQSIPDYNNSMYLGAWSGGSNPDWFDGQIDALDIYSRELTSEEVSNHYNTGEI
jgi:hypothetical protein